MEESSHILARCDAPDKQEMPARAWRCSEGPVGRAIRADENAIRRNVEASRHLIPGVGGRDDNCVGAVGVLSRKWWIVPLNFAVGSLGVHEKVDIMDGH